MHVTILNGHRGSGREMNQARCEGQIASVGISTMCADKCRTRPLIIITQVALAERVEGVGTMLMSIGLTKASLQASAAKQSYITSNSERFIQENENNLSSNNLQDFAVAEKAHVSRFDHFDLLPVVEPLNGWCRGPDCLAQHAQRLPNIRRQIRMLPTAWNPGRHCK